MSSLLGCDSIAILPENMSRERFEWLEKVAGEVIKTPGSESNVKEIFDKCWELKKTRNDIQIFNQFEEFGNPLWHYMVTGKAAEEALLKHEMGPKNRFAGAISSSGSAGSMAFGYYLKDKFPWIKIGSCGSPAVSDSAVQRFWRSPNRRHRRQTCALDSRLQKHRYGDWS